MSSRPLGPTEDNPCQSYRALLLALRRDFKEISRMAGIACVAGDLHKKVIVYKKFGVH